MHIAWLGKKSPFCGNVTYSREVTNALLDRGYDVSFLHFAQEDSQEDLHRELGEVPIPCLYKSQIYTIPSFKSSKILASSLRQLRPDVVHASLTLSPLDFVLPEICDELNLPLVATFHPPFDRKLRNLTSGTQHLMYQLYAPFLANYDRVIVFSRIQQDLLVRLGVPMDRVVVIPNGVNTHKYCPGYSGFKTEIRCDRLFVYQGRIALEKNIEPMVKAWKKAEMGPNSHLVIVGDGPLKSSLKLFYGADLGIHWLGFVGDENRRIEILQSADVFILPSLVEGLSLSLLEAMSCGVACLATDAGADGEAIEGGAGIVLDPQRVLSQLRILLPVLRDQPELSSIMGFKARQRVLERYTLSQNITQIESLYGSLIQQKHQLSTV
ncbi:MAG: glycosyltransferase family 1 protein [Cyanobacteria bacterium WB6_1B_304]|nr:glycosyltransferase family 1 protein [Cyanobacteria bacterium WB6_1B_304]